MQPICPDDFITEENELILYPKEAKHKTIYGEKDWLDIICMDCSKSKVHSMLTGNGVDDISSPKPFKRENTGGNAIAEKTSMLMVSVTIFASATSLNVFGMVTIAILSSPRMLITEIEENRIIKVSIILNLF